MKMKPCEKCRKLKRENLQLKLKVKELEKYAKTLLHEISMIENNIKQ